MGLRAAKPVAECAERAVWQSECVLPNTNHGGGHCQAAAGANALRRLKHLVHIVDGGSRCVLGPGASGCAGAILDHFGCPWQRSRWRGCPSRFVYSVVEVFTTLGVEIDCPLFCICSHFRIPSSGCLRSRRLALVYIVSTCLRCRNHLHLLTKVLSTQRPFCQRQLGLSRLGLRKQFCVSSVSLVRDAKRRQPGRQQYAAYFRVELLQYWNHVSCVYRRQHNHL